MMQWRIHYDQFAHRHEKRRPADIFASFETSMRNADCPAILGWCSAMPISLANGTYRSKAATWGASYTGATGGGLSCPGNHQLMPALSQYLYNGSSSKGLRQSASCHCEASPSRRMCKRSASDAPIRDSETTEGVRASEITNPALFLPQPVLQVWKTYRIDPLCRT